MDPCSCVLRPCPSHDQITSFSMSICYNWFPRVFGIFSYFKFSNLFRVLRAITYRRHYENYDHKMKLYSKNVFFFHKGPFSKWLGWYHSCKSTSGNPLKFSGFSGLLDKLCQFVFRKTRAFKSENWFNLLLYFAKTDRAFVSALSNWSFLVSITAIYYES